MYNPKPLKKGDLRFWVNSEAEDPARPQGPQHYRAEEWPLIENKRYTAAEAAAVIAQIRFGPWRLSLADARGDQQAMAAP